MAGDVSPVAMFLKKGTVSLVQQYTKEFYRLHVFYYLERFILILYENDTHLILQHDDKHQLSKASCLILMKIFTTFLSCRTCPSVGGGYLSVDLNIQIFNICREIEDFLVNMTCKYPKT